jgi:hypothetical protein
MDARNIESFMNRFRALFAGIPYPLTEQSEYHYQTLLYLVENSHSRKWLPL